MQDLTLSNISLIPASTDTTYAGPVIIFLNPAGLDIFPIYITFNYFDSHRNLHKTDTVIPARFTTLGLINTARFEVSHRVDIDAHVLSSYKVMLSHDMRRMTIELTMPDCLQQFLIVSGVSSF
ncbi:unnamed protein product [Phytophthora fragariaefolia]|uniref:Unnamed protein product n=1 Tax=Phytophthora fragariaefolia TaxID=1490495 RepID=A0A9W6Y0H5_9STRA|nr:unnamed protein product [Phytophthora fragariaefolia]